MKRNLLLALLSGILFSIGWPTYGFPLFLFFAFVPLFFIEEDFLQHKKKKFFYFYIYLAFFIWNLLKTWWIYKATPEGGVFAIVVNSLLMATTFWLFHVVRKRLPDKMALPFFVFVWLAFEKFHLNWDFSWPWLNLGNGFSEYPSWIQWYEYTGYLGGTLWVLVLNVLIYKYLSAYFENRNKSLWNFSIVKILFWLLFPILFSFYLKHNYKEKGSSAKVVIVQPNLDPWKEKFKYNNTQLVKNFLELARPGADILIAPETAVSQYTELDNFQLTTPYHLMKEFARKQNMAVLTGVDFIHWYPKNAVDIPETANKNSKGRWYDMYNSAVMITPQGKYYVYHKSKLVVGAEYTPFRKILVPLIGDWVTKTIGVSMGSNVTQKERAVFTYKNIKVAPIICYESIYGEYVTEYVKNGANLLAVITNDGWWGDTEGHRQHLSMARLRAIENRRDVVQSANTGISAHINQKGEIVQKLDYNKRGSILAEVKLNKQLTFYAQHGDYIARVSIFMSVLLFLFAFVKKKIRINNSNFFNKSF